MFSTCDDGIHMFPLSNPPLGNQRWVLLFWEGDLACFSHPLFPPWHAILLCVSSFCESKGQSGTVLTQSEQSFTVSVYITHLTIYTVMSYIVLVSTSPLLEISSSGDDDVPSHICTSCWHKPYLKCSGGIDSLARSVNSKSI